MQGRLSHGEMRRTGGGTRSGGSCPWCGEQETGKAWVLICSIIQL
jgi:hypothetical protein